MCCASLTASRKLAELFAGQLSLGMVVFLDAPLGGGKTFFTRHVLEYCGVPTQEFLGSPTFIFIQSYQIHTPLLQGVFHHIDLYRLAGKQHELHDIGVLELDPAQSIIFLEWPNLYWDTLVNYFPVHWRVQIQIPLNSPRKRIFTFFPPSLHAHN